MILTLRLRPAAVALLALAAACGGGERPSATPAATAAPAAADYSPAAMAARFRRTVPEHPTALGGGATASVDSLLARYARGVAAGDTTALRPLALTVSEFAWLYYLDSPSARPPYELDPDVLWMQMSAQGARGLGRTLERYGGKPLGAWRTSCDAPRAAGALRLLACAVEIHPPGARDAVRLPLSVVERDGLYKLTSFGTSL